MGGIIPAALVLGNGGHGDPPNPPKPPLASTDPELSRCRAAPDDSLPHRPPFETPNK